MKDKFPEAFIQRIQEILPESEQEVFFQYATEPLPKTIRVKKNARIPSSWKLSPVSEIPEAFFVERPNQKILPLGRTIEHFTGNIYSASLSSLLAVKVLDPQPEEKIIDIASAPGSKSTFIADRMKNSGCLICNELSSSRSGKLVANLDRMGVTNAVILQTDGCILNKFFDQEFDRILLDAPCSSEGFGRKESSFFSKMWSEKKILQASKLQKRLIVSAFEILAPEGIMVYSTCTSAPEENEAVVQFLLDTFPDEVEILPVDLGTIPHHIGVSKFRDQTFSPQIWKNVRRIWPHLKNNQWDSEIFFLSRIRKKSALSKSPARKVPFNKNLKVYRKNENARIFSQIAKQFGIDQKHFSKKAILEKNNTLFLVTQENIQFVLKNAFRRAGLPIGQVLPGNHSFCPTTTFALQFGSFAVRNIISLSEEEKNRWLEGYDLSLEGKNNFSDGEYILVQFQNFCLGYGKVQKEGTLLKNKLDRNLVVS